MTGERPETTSPQPWNPGDGAAPTESSVRAPTLQGLVADRRPATWVRRLSWLAPVALFAHYFDLRLLDIRRVFPLLRDDWATYIAAQNFVRTAPWISFPIGRLPDYMAPVGTWLGQTDSWPALYPLYRVLALAMPNRPFQLMGWMLLGSMLGVFGVVRHHVREVMSTDESDRSVAVEVAAAAAGLAFIAQPLYYGKFIHPSLFQMWVIPWAILVGLRVVNDSRDEHPAVSRLALLAPIVVAAALNPYLVVMVAPIVCLPVLLQVRKQPRETVFRLAAAVLAVVVTSYSLGFVGTGGRSASLGFGLYNSEPAALLDAGGRSRMLPDITTAQTHEGYAFPGLGILALATVVLVWWLIDRVRHGPPRDSPTSWPLWLTVAALALWSVLPVVRLFGHDVLDLTALTDPIQEQAAAMRTNGRFVWPLAWMMGLASITFVARRAGARVVAVVLVAVAVVQVVDGTAPFRPAADDQYGPVFAIVRAAETEGIEQVRFQPPLVTTDCRPAEWGSFDQIAQVVVASATEHLSVNSGYPSRGDDRYATEICEDQWRAYDDGRLLDDVLYVIPSSLSPVDDRLHCTPMPLEMSACRLGAPVLEP